MMTVRHNHSVFELQQPFAEPGVIRKGQTSCRMTHASITCSSIIMAMRLPESVRNGHEHGMHDTGRQVVVDSAAAAASLERLQQLALIGGRQVLGQGAAQRDTGGVGRPRSMMLMAKLATASQQQLVQWGARSVIIARAERGRRHGGHREIMRCPHVYRRGAFQENLCDINREPVRHFQRTGATKVGFTRWSSSLDRRMEAMPTPSKEHLHCSTYHDNGSNISSSHDSGDPAKRQRPCLDDA